ncbi:TFIIB-type zinc finger domain-containing protein [Sulfitobacter geojensis]|uniref:TFIIB-type zinc finger domain-containing protein n=1 Tax=Sulfitobacter geojensis TaxID=1342299 RepID=A0AAE2VUI0_9RHOB|nr:TFIIB-type zinc finger domain-containing protein [Sulfitobacter geojensis]MBM1687599.1 TFIIB-type zinc finger domain-containing protein [Sulfitobacter geojensis]MBM1691666.1 TFIIB-type zinc finger domain-containing protein [Sulfitobacter geojensis]MBM1703832.1 TFIIB-type zinc finger domain-containing protein [Sulfitobacter geojensis]MBM1707890.1 TFIIB-type zinc finger domain-containing protein [Sulfitobacter geojensis]MBM1711955.1 TFIIB-type zinc finger domain-containing protein [Sulfitobac
MDDQLTPDAPQSEYRFPCDTCGSDLRYAPDAGRLVCDHCGNTEAIEGSGFTLHPIAELDLRAGLDADLPADQMEETRVTTCPNCAAQVEFDAGKHATECPFCATPVVVDSGTNRHIKPRAVLPFALTQEVARDAMNDWLGALWFAPNGLQEYARKGRRMQGIYVPYWTYDANTDSSYSGQRGTVYYVSQTVMRDGKRVTRQVPKVRWRAASGRVTRFFDDVLVLASKSLPKKYTDALEPWDLSALEPYAPEYLAGFRAEAYAVSLRDGFVEARAHMDRVIERDVKFDIGGDRQRVHNIDTRLNNLTFKHVLLPVWLAAYKYRGKTYRFVVNGRTGRVQGERPFSAIKITIAVILGAIAAGIIGYLAAQK